MRTKGSSAELERRRSLAVERLLEGFSTVEVAEFLEVEPRSVQRWWKQYSLQGWEGLASTGRGGRPPKLTSMQEKIVLRWLRESPTAFGFDTDLWTCRRLAQLIEQEWSIGLHPRYLPQWLRQRGLSSQKSQRVPRERCGKVIGQWLLKDWPRIKKRRSGTRPTSFSSMKAGF